LALCSTECSVIRACTRPRLPTAVRSGRQEVRRVVELCGDAAWRSSLRMRSGASWLARLTPGRGQPQEGLNRPDLRLGGWFRFAFVQQLFHSTDGVLALRVSAVSEIT